MDRSFGGAALTSKSRIENSRSVVKKVLQLIERRQQLSRANLVRIEKYIREYGLNPADFTIANANFQRSLTNDVALGAEIWNARVQLYQSALGVLAFAQQKLGQSQWQDGKYTLRQPEDEREIFRLFGLMQAAGVREGAAIDRYQAHTKNKKVGID